MTTHAVIITYLRDQTQPAVDRSAGSTGHAY
ncbi:integral membrane protein YrbE2a [Mycobacterium tuberculosis]|nr:integral membrane protein YrbE2a [Mycobacterium tuberculosis]